MAKYSKGASDKVGDVMHEMKQGKLRSGRSGKKVTSRKQAIAIGLSEARKEGAKVPKKSAPKKKAAAKKKGAKKSAARKTGSSMARKSAGKKSSGRKRSSGGRKKAAKKTSGSSRSRAR